MTLRVVRRPPRLLGVNRPRQRNRGSKDNNRSHDVRRQVASGPVYVAAECSGNDQPGHDRGDQPGGQNACQLISCALVDPPHGPQGGRVDDEHEHLAAGPSSAAISGKKEWA